MPSVAFYTLGCKVNQYESSQIKQAFLGRGYVSAPEDEPADVYIVNSCSVTRLADRKSRQFIRRARKMNPDAVIVCMGCYPETNPEEVSAIEEVDIMMGTTDKLSVVDKVEAFLAECGRLRYTGSVNNNTGFLSVNSCESRDIEIESNRNDDKNNKKLCAYSINNKEKPLSDSFEKSDGNLSTEAGHSSGENRILEDVLKTDCFASETASKSKSASSFQPVTDPDSRTRAMIQIQSGCNRFCSYCVIPYARRDLISKPVSDIVEEAKQLIAAGYKEIVLTGINTALYEGGVGQVIAALNELPGDFRIRLGSMEPTVVDAEYVAGLMKYDKLCHHVHMSVQSGSNRIIKAMNRHYTREEYLKIVDVLRSVDPLYGITTDIITGFPGETGEDFKESLDLVKEVGFLKVHGFPYSVRLFTRAAEMPDQIAPPVKKARNKELIELAEQVSFDFRKKMAGSVQRVLAEEEVDTRYTKLWKGHADNFCPVYFRYDGNPANQYVNIKIIRPFEDGVYGEEDKMEDCLFCKIGSGEIPTTVIYEDDKIMCFPDLAPQAPVHILMIPKKHISSLDATTPEDAELISYMMLKVKEIAAMQGLDEGYRTVINTGDNGGQTVKHLHIHILGGRFMTWPPG